MKWILVFSACVMAFFSNAHFSFAVNNEEQEVVLKKIENVNIVSNSGKDVITLKGKRNFVSYIDPILCVANGETNQSMEVMLVGIDDVLEDACTLSIGEIDGTKVVVIFTELPGTGHTHDFSVVEVKGNGLEEKEDVENIFPHISGTVTLLNDYKAELKLEGSDPCTFDLLNRKDSYTELDIYSNSGEIKNKPVSSIQGFSDLKMEGSVLTGTQDVCVDIGRSFWDVVFTIKTTWKRVNSDWKVEKMEINPERGFFPSSSTEYEEYEEYGEYGEYGEYAPSLEAPPAA